MSLPAPLTPDELQEMVDAIPNEQLVNDLLHMTHRMHEAKTQHALKRLRTERDLLQGEILRRMVNGHA